MPGKALDVWCAGDRLSARRMAVGDAIDDIAMVGIKIGMALRRPEVVRDALGAALQAVRRQNVETGGHASAFQDRCGMTALPGAHPLGIGRVKRVSEDRPERRRPGPSGNAACR